MYAARLTIKYTHEKIRFVFASFNWQYLFFFEVTYVSPNLPVDIDDPYWSQKVGLELEPPFKTAHQWSKDQINKWAESLGLTRFFESSAPTPPLVYDNCPRRTIRDSETSRTEA